MLQASQALSTPPATQQETKNYISKIKGESKLDSFGKPKNINNLVNHVKEDGEVSLRTLKVTLKVRDLDETKEEVVKALLKIVDDTCELDTHLSGPSPRKADNSSG